MISLTRLDAGADEESGKLAVLGPKTMTGTPASNRIAVRRVRVTFRSLERTTLIDLWCYPNPTVAGRLTPFSAAGREH